LIITEITGQLLAQVRISAAIFGCFPHPVCSHSIFSRSIELLDPNNIGVATEILLISRQGAEINVFAENRGFQKKIRN
jgi:hypothetical protein